jgi:hypothetical protein
MKSILVLLAMLASPYSFGADSDLYCRVYAFGEVEVNYAFYGKVVSANGIESLTFVDNEDGSVILEPRDASFDPDYTPRSERRKSFNRFTLGYGTESSGWGETYTEIFLPKDLHQLHGQTFRGEIETSGPGGGGWQPLYCYMD